MVTFKKSFPYIVVSLVFLALVFFSFKHERLPLLDDEPPQASLEERMDQLTMSASSTNSELDEPVPAASAAGGIAAITQPTPKDLSQLQTLEQILSARNDNDPRMDTELKELSPEAKRLMRSRYATTQAEKRNQRGTIVFLLGRDLSSPEDVAFLRSVLNEPPCLSFTDCTKEETRSAASGDHEHGGGDEVTLAYPQLVALKRIEAYLGQPNAGPLAPALKAEVEAARRSPVRKVAALAEEISKKW